MDANNRLTRRRILAWGAVLSVMALPRPAGAFTAVPNERHLSFYNLHTGETLKSTYWADGHYVGSARQDIDFILRDFRTGDVNPIDPGLLDTLFAVQKRLESHGTFQVISGFRSPKTNATLAQNSSGVAKKSYHMKGLAIDVRLSDCPLDKLHKAALSLQRGGVGYYPDSDFVHIDVGPVRSW